MICWVVMLSEAGSDIAVSSVAYGVKQSDMIWHIDTDIKCHVLDWYSMTHSRVVRLTYVAELPSLLDATNAGRLLQTCLEQIIRGVRSALELIGSPRVIPMDAGVDARAVYVSITATQLHIQYCKHLIFHARGMRGFLEAGYIDRLCWCGTHDMLPDVLTKGSVEREALVPCCYEGVWRLRNAEPMNHSFSKFQADDEYIGQAP